ncbi:MAG: hypothetical protein GY861_25495, partial [bacterium]|nr:hypothetical protein [bacterium]
IEGSLIKIKIESTIETFRGFQEYSVRYLPEGAPVSYPFELDTTKVTVAPKDQEDPGFELIRQHESAIEEEVFKRVVALMDPYFEEYASVLTKKDLVKFKRGQDAQIGSIVNIIIKAKKTAEVDGSITNSIQTINLETIEGSTIANVTFLSDNRIKITFNVKLVKRRELMADLITEVIVSPQGVEAAVSEIYPANTVEEFIELNTDAIAALPQVAGIGYYYVFSNRDDEKRKDRLSAKVKDILNKFIRDGVEQEVHSDVEDVHSYNDDRRIREVLSAEIVSFSAEGFLRIKFTNKFTVEEYTTEGIWDEIATVGNPVRGKYTVESVVIIPTQPSKESLAGVGGSLLGLMDSATKIESLRQGLATDGLTAKEIHEIYQRRWMAPNNYPEDDKDGRVNIKTERPFSVRTIESEVEAGLRAGLFVDIDGNWQPGQSVRNLRVRFNPSVVSLAQSSDAFSSFAKRLNVIEVAGSFPGRAGNNPLGWRTIPDAV